MKLTATPIRIRGFTLIELMVALVLLALILTAAAPIMQLNAKRTQEQELKRALWEIRDAIDDYKQAADQGLIKKQPDETGYPPTLQILVQGVENKRDPKKGKVYFLRRIPRDPFATDAALANEETWGKRSYSSSFEEPEAGDDIYDVYSLSPQIGINQRPYREW